MPWRWRWDTFRPSPEIDGIPLAFKATMFVRGVLLGRELSDWILKAQEDEEKSD